MTQKNKRRSEKDLNEEVAVEKQEVQQMMRVERGQNRRLRQKMILRRRRKL